MVVLDSIVLFRETGKFSIKIVVYDDMLFNFLIL